MSKAFGLEHAHYVTLLPKSITTAIGMGVSEEAGGIVTLTVVSIIITGILGNIIADWLFGILKIEEPMAKGLRLGQQPMPSEPPGHWNWERLREP